MPVFIYSALALGLMSSLHCLGMCGPLVIGIIPRESSGFQKVWTLVLYHSGRIFIYAAMGFLIGWLGQSIQIPNFQQILSIVLGVLVLLWVLGKYYFSKLPFSFTWINSFIHAAFGRFVNIKGDVRYLLMGSLNGLLPCGMVYIALAGALTLTHAWQSIAFMGLFGLGTLPLLLLVSGLGNLLKAGFRNFVRKLQPIFLISFAVILMLRGLNLGIPYLSPKVSATHDSAAMECCQKD